MVHTDSRPVAEANQGHLVARETVLTCASRRTSDRARRRLQSCAIRQIMTEAKPKWTSLEGYELRSGRWSRKVAPKFVAWLDVDEDVDWLDVGRS